MSNKVLKITVDKGIDRLDKFLAEQFPDVSRSQIDKLINDHHVTVNDDLKLPKYHVQSGDQISLTFPAIKNSDLLAEDIPLDIIYEDDDLIVVNKPQGMVVHPSAGHADHTLVNALLAHAPLSTINGQFRPGIVHRIDKDTSGLLMVAKNNFAHERLSDDLRKHKTGRKYLALVHGNFHEQTGTIKAPIGRDPKNRQKQAVIASGRSAVTHFKVLEQFKNYALIEAILETGRTHQIRVHMAYIGHPVAADPLYGPKKTLSGHGQYLHAASLTLTQPHTGQELSFSTPVPEEFQKMLSKLRNSR
ncbi:RluA family pseudouridine synthase [Oenococcus sicerae]|uniref:RluA family pseudouridine synthase n=1 Tax=Oenococcus sicerae TaxID=2203724 RepID=UPI0010AF4883|nr:Ribosomal large subunit pseudouridine synthase D [Oenococcus sicerae]